MGGSDGFILERKGLMMDGREWSLIFRKVVNGGWRVVGDGRVLGDSDLVATTGKEKVEGMAPLVTEPDHHTEHVQEPVRVEGPKQGSNHCGETTRGTPNSAPSRLQGLGVIPKQAQHFQTTVVGSMDVPRQQKGGSVEARPVLRTGEHMDVGTDMPVEFHDDFRADPEVVEETAMEVETFEDEANNQADFVEDGATMLDVESSSSDEEECGEAEQVEQQDMEAHLDGIGALFIGEDDTRQVTNIVSHFGDNYCLPNVCNRERAMESITTSFDHEQEVQAGEGSGDVFVVEGGREVSLADFLEQMGLSLVKRDVRS